MKKAVISLMGIFLIIIITISCQGEKVNSIRIGVILPLTGSKATFGEMEKNSFELARKEINQAGGIQKKKLEFIYEDDTGKPDVGRLGMEKLILRDRVPLVVGGYSSSVTFSAAQVAQKYRVPFLVNTGAVDKITEPGAYNLRISDNDNFYIYRLNPPVSEYAQSLNGFLDSVAKVKSAIIIHENTTFGSKSAQSFSESCQKAGIEVAGIVSYTEGTVDFKPMLLRAKETGAELLYMTSYVMDGAMIMKQAREIKLFPKLYVGNGAGFTMPAFRENAGIASEKVISTTLWHQSLPIKGAKTYYDNYIHNYGEENPPDYHGAEAYAAAYVVYDVLSRCKTINARQVKQALDKTDVETVFGPVKFSAYGNKLNQNKADTYVVQWIEGKLRLIWPLEKANISYVFPIDWEREWQY